MIGQPWMSMLVGAYKPRQNTAFALEEFKVIVAAKDARAAHSSNNTRMVFSPALAIPHGLILIGARTQRKALRRWLGFVFTLTGGSNCPPRCAWLNIE